MEVRTLFSALDPAKPVSIQAYAGIVRLPDGAAKKLRKNFPLEDFPSFAAAEAAARRWAEEKRPESPGRAAVQLSAERLADAVQALALVEPYQLTLTELAQAFVEERQAKPNWTFAEACESFLADPATVARGRKYLHEARRLLTPACERFGATPCDRVSADAMRAFLIARTRTEPTWKASRAFLSNVLNHAILHGRARYNPAPNLKRPVERYA